MPKAKKPPSYLLHKPSGRARVRLNGRDIYLGAYGTPESREAYHRLVAAWERNGRESPPQNADLTVRELSLRADQQSRGGGDLSVNELVLAYVRHAELYYRKNARQTHEVQTVKAAMKRLTAVYGLAPAVDFGPLALKAVRQHMMDEGGLSRGSINRYVGHIRRMFRWAVSNELVPASAVHALEAVDALKRGRTSARESPPVKPVAQSHVESVLPHVSRQVGAMIRLQLLTGMRPGEVCLMRVCDIDMGGSIWLYRPADHKTAHHDAQREIALGPRAQAILKPFLSLDRSRSLLVHATRRSNGAQK